MIRYLFLLLTFVLFISGCAPQYAVKNIYIPPVGQKAKQCINECTNARNECQSKCDLQYNQCLNDAYERAKDIKAIMDKRYKRRYNKYLKRLSDYNLKIFDWQNEYDQNYQDWSYFRNKCKTSHDTYACNREDDLRYIVKRMLRNKPREPKPPRQKSFNEIVSNEQSLCKRECGCQKDFDICFLNCGGEIQMRKICIKNCDKQ